jgi:hypothetical protein
MWELRKKLSLGRYSQRYFSLVAAVILMATFVAGPLFGNIAYAEDAKRSGDSLTYQGKTYTKVANSNEIPQAVRSAAPNTSGFRLLDEQGKKAYFILTATDPATATAGYYVVYDFTPPDQFSNSSPPVEVKIANSDTPEAQNAASQGGTSNCNNSETGAIGWIICPVVTFLASSMDNIYGFIANFFRVDTITNNPNSTLYQMWSFVRDIANVCFVIGFLIIVFSQITSLGISNYGIKKTLPRLIIAAILVNTSYLLAAVSVDISNLLGYSIHSFFQGLMEHFNTGAQYTNTGVSVPEVPRWGVVAGGILAGTTVLGLAVHTGAIFMLVPLLVGAILAALVALIILAARQALIVIMVIISPLAFVAYLLPNTEKYFDKWRSAFLTLLFLFPIFSVLFSGAQVAGLAIVQNANGNILTVILGMAVQVAPLFITPMLIKFSSGILGRVAGMINDRSKGPVDRLRNWATGAAQERRNNVLKNYNPNKKWQRFDPTRRAVRSAGLYSRRVADRRKNAEAGAQNAYNASRWGIKSQEEARNIGAEKDEIDNRFNETHHDILRRERTAATRKTEVENDFNRNNHAILERQHLADVDKTRVDTEFSASTMGRNVDTARREAERAKQQVETKHEQAWHFRNLNDAGSQERELKFRATKDEADLEKSKVEALYSEIKAGDGRFANRGIDPVELQKLVDRAHTTTEQTSLTVNRSKEAESALSTKINEAMLNNGAVFQVDASGNKVLDASGKPIVIENRKIDGMSLREYASGIGNESSVLAQVVAKSRKEFGEQVAEQKELSSHFKLNAGQIRELALGNKIGAVYDGEGNEYTFDNTDEHVHDMAADEIFNVGAHDDKMRVFWSAAKGGPNYEYRRTIQQAAIRSGLKNSAPSVNDKTLDAMINGTLEPNGDDSWQYHSFRQVLEGRLSANALSTTHANSLRRLFVDVNESSRTREMFDKLIKNSAPAELKALQDADPSRTFTQADAEASLRRKFADQRSKLLATTEQVLKTPTIRQNASMESVDMMRAFTRGDHITEPKNLF